MAKEIWFKCLLCGEESYCDTYFDAIPDAEVMCPFCLNRMKLKDARVATDAPACGSAVRETNG